MIPRIRRLRLAEMPRRRRSDRHGQTDGKRKGRFLTFVRRATAVLIIVGAAICGWAFSVTDPQYGACNDHVLVGSESSVVTACEALSATDLLPLYLTGPRLARTGTGLGLGIGAAQAVERPASRNR